MKSRGEYGITDREVGRRHTQVAAIATACLALIAASCSVQTDEATPIVGERRTDLAPQVAVESGDPGDSGLVGFEVVVPATAASLRAADRRTTANQATIEFPSASDATLPEATGNEQPPTGDVAPETTDTAPPSQPLGEDTADDAIAGDGATAAVTEAESSPALPAATTDAAAETAAAETATSVNEAQAAPAAATQAPATVASVAPATETLAAESEAPPTQADPTPTPASDALVVGGTSRDEGPVDGTAITDDQISESASLSCSTVELALADLDRGDLGQFSAEMAVAAGFASTAPEPTIRAEEPNLLSAANAPDPIGAIATFLSACVALGYQL